MFLAKPDLPRSQADRIKALLLDFPREVGGTDFMGQIGYSTIRPVNESIMKRADPYLKETRKVLGAR